MYCLPNVEDGCKPEQDLLAWRRCLGCNAMEIFVDVPSKHGECQWCSKQDPPGEIRSLSTNKCEVCSQCMYLLVDESRFTEEEFTAEKENIGNNIFTVNKKKQWNMYDILGDFGDFLSFSRKEITGTCIPLERRVLALHTVQDDSGSRPYIQVEGFDKHKRKIERYESDFYKYMVYVPENLPDNYAVEKENEECSYKKCSDICVGLYEYSDGCGPSHQGRAYVYETTANGNTAPRLLETVNNEFSPETEFPIIAEPHNTNSLGWRLKSQGECKLCTQCNNNQFNQYCNVYEAVFGVTITGSGKCEDCLNTCDTYFYLWHADGFKGCNPAEDAATRVDANSIEVQRDYECRRCAAAVLIKSSDQLYVVAGCGDSTSYKYHDKGSDGILQQVTKVSKLENDTIYYKEHELLPYCPVEYYYDTTQAECSLTHFDEDIDTTNLEPKKYEPLTSETKYRVECCKLCTVCDIRLGMKKDTQNYQRCDGTGTQDTQAHCVKKCPFGHYESDQNTCTKCKTCSCGESPESFIDQSC